MTRQVILSEEDFIWLHNMMIRGKEKVLKNATAFHLDMGEQILRVNKAFENAVKIKDAEEETLAEVESKPAKTQKKRARRTKVEPMPLPRNACAEHPKYGGQRAPRTPCEGCWNFYKFLHPASFHQARRRFELQQRRKQRA